MKRRCFVWRMAGTLEPLPDERLRSAPAAHHAGVTTASTDQKPRRKPKHPMDPVIRDAVYSLMDCGYSFIAAVKKAKAEAPRIKKEYADRASGLAAQEALRDAWTHPVGTPVWVRRDDGHEEATTTRSKPWMVADHASILLVGITGGFLLERVRIRDGVPRPGGLCPECGGCAGVDGSDRCVCTPKGGTA